MTPTKPAFRNPLGFILNTTIFLFLLLLAAYLGIQLIIIQNVDPDRIAMFQNMLTTIKLVAINVFDFIKPFLQLVIILVIMEWLLNKFGLSLSKNSIKFEWNIQTAIGLIVIVAFALAALSGVQGAHMLKDVALVVVGFYFGTQRKNTEINDGNSKIVTVEEHTNERGNGEQNVDEK